MSASTSIPTRFLFLPHRTPRFRASIHVGAAPKRCARDLGVCDMGGVSIWHWIVVGVVVMLLFGRGKVSELMGDVAKGIKAFKKGMADDDEPPRPTQAR